MKLLLTLFLTCCLLTVNAQLNVLQNGNFEATTLSGWTVSGFATVANRGLVAGSARSAHIAATSGKIAQSVLNVSSDWSLDFYVACENPELYGADRGFNMNINVNQLNMRIGVGGSIQFYNGSAWMTVGNGNEISFSTDANNDGDLLDDVDGIAAHRIKIVTRNFGGVGAVYDVWASAPNSDVLKLVAENVSFFQSIPATINTVTFTTAFGMNTLQSYLIDNCVLKNMKPIAFSVFSGIYPHLAMTNSDSECGVGAVVPWQGDLWYVTYSAHYPNGSDDKLYQLDTALNVIARSESVGGTPANRMIHSESNQLIIGSHLIDATKNVRSILPATMPGRMTANARHLTDPHNRVYFVTMEEGIYDVDVNTLNIKTLHGDVNTSGITSIVPGQHTKGAYTGQNRLMIANNGVGGVLAEWKGMVDGDPNVPASWTLVDVNKHAEITSKGGIYGATSQNDPVWSLGWDKRSVLLNVCDNGGVWKRFRLPKASYTHDADHGWYTEWPRIRDIGYNNGNYLMNMHGLMYQFPANFSHANTGGIKPFSTFLKMIVDYAEWNNKIVLGCNDATKFSNGLCPRDQSNLIFTTREELADFGGKPYGFGSVLLNDSIEANVASEAMLINGYENRMIHFKQKTGKDVVFKLETDISGNNNWTELTQITIPAAGYAYYILPSKLDAQWIRILSDSKIKSASATFYLSNGYCASKPEFASSFPGPSANKSLSSGVIRPMAESDMKLQFAADIVDEQGITSKAYYEIDGFLNFVNVTNATAENNLRTTYFPTKDFTVDNASVIMTSGGSQYRLPMGDEAFNNPLVSGYARGIREVVTERSLMNIHGTFYELPRDDAGGFLKIRPITTHNKQIFDFCSWRGMLVLSGNFNSAENAANYRKSVDGKAGLWFGNVDDLFKMGTPRGIGSTWKETAVTANSPSLPYLMQGYNDKKVELSHNLSETVNFTLEVDFLAEGTFEKAFTIAVKAGEKVTFNFPTGFNAQWIRTVADKNCVATATFYYNTDVNNNNETKQISETELLLFPNPATDILHIQGLVKPTSVVVYNLAGCVVQSEIISNQLNISGLSAGVYLLRINNRKPQMFVKK